MRLSMSSLWFGRRKMTWFHTKSEHIPNSRMLMLRTGFSGLRNRLSAAFARYGFPLLSLVRRDFKIRYSPTVLGLGWTVLQPLVLILIYTFVFSAILKVQFKPIDRPGGFVLYLLSGFLPYLSLSEGIQRGSTCLIENRYLLDKVVFPAEVLAAAGVISATITEIIGLVLLIGLAAVYGLYPSAWLLLMPLLLLMRIAITLGFAWVISILSVFFKDCGQFIGLLLMVWMFLTPIFYPLEAVPPNMIWLVNINPLYLVIAVYRAVILEATPPPLDALLSLTAWVTAITGFGLWFFRQTVDRAKDFL